MSRNELELIEFSKIKLAHLHFNHLFLFKSIYIYRQYKQID